MSWVKLHRQTVNLKHEYFFSPATDSVSGYKQKTSGIQELKYDTEYIYFKNHKRV